MNKLFNITEEEKNRIRGLHLTETKDDRITSEINDLNSKIEEQLKLITGEYASVSDRGESMRAKFTYVRRDFDDEVWGGVLNFISGMGFEILDGTSNYYEKNWEPEEPAESVPTINFR